MRDIKLNSYRVKFYFATHVDEWGHFEGKRKSEYIYIDARYREDAVRHAGLHHMADHINDGEFVVKITAAKIATAQAMEAIGAPTLFPLGGVS